MLHQKTVTGYLNKYETIVFALLSAVNERNFRPLAPLLADNFFGHVNLSTVGLHTALHTICLANGAVKFSRG